MTHEAFFIPVGDGQRFCLYHPADRTVGMAPLGLIVYVHPFAEEMNKTRRMAAIQARSMSTAGYAVLQIDLFGCGDSSGDFGEATWAKWVEDVVLASRWLREKSNTDHGQSSRPGPPLWLWGLRAGCLLAVQAAEALQEPCHFLFWAPSSSGAVLLQQFMRLKATAALASGNAQSVMTDLRAELALGRAVEVAGYLLAPDLASGLEQARLSPPIASGPAMRVEWFELSTRTDATPSPVAIKSIAGWRDAGNMVREHLVRGPSFWQTTEIEDAPDLVASTTMALLEAAAA